VDGPVRADGQGGAQRLLGRSRADRDDDDLVGRALLLQPDRLFDGDLAERID
jgi:hypothetical protein